MHAYSILEVREVTPPVGGTPKDLGIGICPETGLLRMLRVRFAPFVSLVLTLRRNPHGDEGAEWRGQFSDADLNMVGSGASEMQRTGKNDGIFWMNYQDFLMGEHAMRTD